MCTGMESMVNVDTTAAVLACYWQCLIQYTVTLIIIIFTCLTPHRSCAPSVPYHMSILSSQAWVDELLLRHPNRIHDSLGVHKETFLKLVRVMCNFGLE